MKLGIFGWARMNECFGWARMNEGDFAKNQRALPCAAAGGHKQAASASHERARRKE
jgi:hypothetical protein